MKQTTLYLSLMLLLLFSCKSHRDVSRSTTYDARGESLATMNDSLQTHLETSQKSEGSQQDDRFEYSRTTEFGNDSNVTSITETYIIINSRFDFNSQLDKIKREDFKYNAAVATSNTTSDEMDERVLEKKDNRPVQGAEWLAVIIGLAIVAALILIIYRRRRR